jgi:hypothetical protein
MDDAADAAPDTLDHGRLHAGDTASVQSTIHSIHRKVRGLSRSGREKWASAGTVAGRRGKAATRELLLLTQ